MAGGESRGWASTTALLEALGGAGAALWRFDARADRRSWQSMLALFDEVLPLG